MKTEHRFINNEGTTLHMQKFCKGVCDGIESPRPIGNPYRKGYCFCTRCGIEDGVWMLQEHMKANGKCPCCNYRPRYGTLDDKKYWELKKLC